MCGSESIAVKVHSPGGDHLLGCSACGTLFHAGDKSSPGRPEGADVGHSPATVYGPRARIRITLLCRAIARAYSEYLESRIDISRVATVFEIGSQYGHLLRLLRRRGVDACGVDANPGAVERGVLQAPFLRHLEWTPETPFPTGLDLIIIPQVIYYFRQADVLLQRALKAVKRGGYVFLATVNLDEARVVRRALALEAEYAGRGLTPQSNSCLPTRQGLMAFCREQGVQIIDCTPVEPVVRFDDSPGPLFLLRYEVLRRPAYVERSTGYHLHLILQRQA